MKARCATHDGHREGAHEIMKSLAYMVEMV